MNKKLSKFLLPVFRTTALLTGMMTGYYQRVFAGTCAGGSGTYLCGGGANASSDSTQNLSGSPLTVTTQSGFGINTSTSGGNAFTLTGTNGLTFTDKYASSITGVSSGISANNTGGALAVTTNGMVTANQTGIYAHNYSGGTSLIITANDAYANAANGIGIRAKNYGNSALAITADGQVSGGNIGIDAHNYGTSLTITAHGNVYGGYYGGIWAKNHGTGALTITTDSQASGNYSGIVAYNYGTSLTITARGNVYGYGSDGIWAENHGTGALTITADSTVHGYYDGIVASNNGTSLTITAHGDVTGANGTQYNGRNYGYGIWAGNYGSGALTITADGAVTGYYAGIYAINKGTSLTITAHNVSGYHDYGIHAINLGTGALTITAHNVSGQTYGILAENEGSGALTITTDGTVTGSSQPGILAYNSSSGTSLTITAHNVSGYDSGIWADNEGSGALTITTNGTVTGSSGPGIYAVNYRSSTTIDIGPSSVVQGSVGGIYALSVNGNPIAITVAGTVQNTSGNPADPAIMVMGGPTTLNLEAGSHTTGSVELGTDSDTFTLAGSLNGSATLGAGNDTFIRVGGSTLTGTIDAGTGTDTLGFDNMGTVDASAWGTTYLNFENLGFYGGTTRLTGTWNLGGGTATVHSGTLSLDGTLLASTLTIERGGLLAGNGAIDGELIDYGTISPGHSIGTLTVNGSLAFKPGSTYIVQLDSNGNSDLVRVNGPTTISGGTMEVSPERTLYQNGSKWTVLTATGGIHGTFSSIAPNFTSYTLNFEQTIQGKNLDLVLVRTPYADFGDTANQKAVGGALDTLLPEAYGSIADLLTSMDFDMNPDQLAATLGGLNPEMYTSFAPSGLEVAGIYRRTIALRQQEADMQPASGHLWNAWARLTGDWMSRHAQDGVSGYSLDSTGAIFGIDRRFDSTTRAGLVLGSTSGNLSWDEAGSKGSISSKHIGLYAGTRLKGFFLDGSLGYTSLDNSGSRSITTSVFTTGTSASFSGNVWDAALSGYYDFQLGMIHLGPVASVNYERLSQDGFTETGGEFAVHIQDSTSQSLNVSLGFRASGNFTYGNWRFQPKAMLAVTHQFKDDPTELTAYFINYPDASFTVSDAKPADNKSVASARLTGNYNGNLSLYLDASATLADNRNSRMLSAGMIWNF